VNSSNTEQEENTPDKELEFIAPLILHAGTDLKVGKFSISPRLTWMDQQHLSGIADASGPLLKRQTIPGYTLLNISLGYHVTKHFYVFANGYNVLNQKYKSSGAFTDTNKQETEFFYGQHQDPVRIMGGINFTF
jgi:outer membrane receptor protein involved in Fe transport